MTIMTIMPKLENLLRRAPTTKELRKVWTFTESEAERDIENGLERRRKEFENFNEDDNQFLGRQKLDNNDLMQAIKEAENSSPG